VGSTIANDQLKVISLFPNYEITFLRVVETLGEPDYISLTLTPNVHSPGCSISLIWADQHIIIDHIDEASTEMCDSMSSNEKKISSELTTDSITYLLPEYIELRIETGGVLPWSGFIGR
jgi:hypothetical protein